MNRTTKRVVISLAFFAPTQNSSSLSLAVKTKEVEPSIAKQALVLGASYAKISGNSCSATTNLRRKDEWWVVADIFPALEQICMEAYDHFMGLALENLCVDGYIVKAPVVMRALVNTR